MKKSVHKTGLKRIVLGDFLNGELSMKKVLIAAALLFSSGVQGLENEPLVHKESEADIREKQLLGAAHLYLSNLDAASSLDTAEITDRVSLMCAPNCRKIVNGKVIFENREYYSVQLSNAKKEVGAWSVHPLEILTHVDDHLVVIRHLVYTEKAGTLTVFLILRYNDEFRITEINEVFNQFEGINEIPQIR
jgi:hypothetical protein